MIRKISGLLIFLFGLNALYAQESMSVMTYNIKLDYPKEGRNNWNSRKNLMVGQFNFYEPDIFGVQEAMPNQISDLDSLLVNYNFVGVGRDDGKNTGEYAAIFFNKKRFKVLESGTFWLSETPNKVSMGWDAVCNRICTYALFENINAKKCLWVFNTHLDHKGEVARMKSPKLILKKIKVLNPKNLPVILMGDFNLEPTNQNIYFVEKHLNDSRKIAQLKPFGPTGTFNGFDINRPVTRRIDYIFLSKTDFTVKKYAVLSHIQNGRYLSDHFPVYLEIVELTDFNVTPR